MNLLEIIMIVVTAGFALAGFRKGFVRKLASMLSLVLSILLVSFSLPYVTDFLKNSTPVYEFIVDRSGAIVENQIEELLGRQGQDTAEAESASLSRVNQTEVIDDLPVPQILKDRLLDYNNDEGYMNLHVSSFQDYVTHFIANMIMSVVSFLAAVIIVRLVLWAVIAALDLLAHAPVISILNRLAGMLLGLLQALAFIWIAFLLLSMFSGTEAGLYLLSMVQESEWLCQLYDSNLFLQIVLQATALLA